MECDSFLCTREVSSIDDIDQEDNDLDMWDPTPDPDELDED
jgi:hypothetical protein